MTGPPEWRYFPELLRELARVPGGSPCRWCGTVTEAMHGPRADLEGCPRCRALVVEEKGGGRALVGFTAVAGAPVDRALAQPSLRSVSRVISA